MISRPVSAMQSTCRSVPISRGPKSLLCFKTWQFGEVGLCSTSLQLGFAICDSICLLQEMGKACLAMMRPRLLTPWQVHGYESGSGCIEARCTLFRITCLFCCKDMTRANLIRALCTAGVSHLYQTGIHIMLQQQCCHTLCRGCNLYKSPYDALACTCPVNLDMNGACPQQCVLGLTLRASQSPPQSFPGYRAYDYPTDVASMS